MVSANQFRLVSDAQRRIKKTGFNMIVWDDRFDIVPAKGASAVMFSLGWKKSFAMLEEAIAFCEGWKSMEAMLYKKSGMDLKELKDRVAQQKVMDALKGKMKR